MDRMPIVRYRTDTRPVHLLSWHFAVRSENPVTQTILLIQGDPGGAAVVREALAHTTDEAFALEWAHDLASGLERLTVAATEAGERGHGVAAVLVDLFLPDSRGIETFDQVCRVAPHRPILVLCESDGEDIGRLAVHRGAQDYVLKSRLDSYLLPKALHNAIERVASAETLHAEKERSQVTLNSIGDAVVSTDRDGNVTYLNRVAESMTGWLIEEARGRRFEVVLKIVDATTRASVDNPMTLAVRDNTTVGLTGNCVLVRRDGAEAAIEDSAAPIHDCRGRVTGAVMVFRDVSRARALSQRMSHLAQHDGLTDLPNRALLNDRLTQAIAFARRRRGRLAVLFLDIDEFKGINDSLGHAAGDRLLQSVSERLLASVRASDTVSRLGGDEFVIVLAEVTDASDAASGADKILRAFGAPHRIGQHELQVTASIGVVTYPEDGGDAPTLMKNADLAMYHAKGSGGNRYQSYAPGMTPPGRPRGEYRSAQRDGGPAGVHETGR
jgi:diguanylate cyclase (GGDEF)-like protein/PAS domain S-box-containing protein